MVEIGQADFAGGGCLTRHHDFFHLLDHLDARLHLRRLCGSVSERVYKALHLVAQPILVAFGGNERVVALYAFLNVEIVAAVVARDGAAIHFDGDVGQRAQKIPVV